MFCRHCGRSLEEDARFCVHCGQPVGMLEDEEPTELLEPVAPDGPDSDEEPTELLEPVAPDEMETVVIDPADVEGSREALDSLDAPEGAAGPAAAPRTPTEVFEPVVPATPVHYVAPEASARQTAPATPDAKGGGRKPLLIALIVLLSLAIVAVVGLITYQQELWGGRTLPDVTGLEADQAEQTLEDLGFTVETYDVKADDGLGTVVEMDATAGRRTSVRQTIGLGVGVARVVPDVVGASLEDAQSLLAAEGATNVKVDYRSSDISEGTVLAVDPDVASSFRSGDPITVTVSQPYTVPDVVGATQDDATSAISANGLVANVVWAESDQPAYQVLSIDPVAGTRTQSGAIVTVTVASPGPRDVYHLMDYFDCDPTVLPRYLSWRGFTFDFGYTYTGGSAAGTAKEAWVLRSGSTGSPDEIVFTADPASHHNMWFPGDPDFDALAGGAGFAGIRFEPSGSLALCTPTVNMDTVQTYMKACGFDNMTDSCTQDDIVTPYRISPGSTRFLCASGETDGCVWTILVYTTGSGSKGVAITCAPKALYASKDLSQFGGSVCDYVAYIDMYTE